MRRERESKPFHNIVAPTLTDLTEAEFRAKNCPNIKDIEEALSKEGVPQKTIDSIVFMVKEYSLKREATRAVIMKRTHLDNRAGQYTFYGNVSNRAIGLQMDKIETYSKESSKRYYEAHKEEIAAKRKLAKERKEKMGLI